MDDFFLENTINQLESSFDEVSKLKFTLLDSTLEQIEYIFELDAEAIPVFKTLPKEEIKELHNSLIFEILPLMEEFKYDDGIKKIKEWEKLIQENLD